MQLDNFYFKIENPKMNNNIISVKELTRVFNKTAAAYKYYWFISILQLNARNPEIKQIEVRTILIKMICNAWYPVNYFKLNFGFSDKLNEHIIKIQAILSIPVDISLDNLFNTLHSNTNGEVEKLINHFSQNVPYRFLSPWIKYTTNKEVIQKSKKFQNNCLYRLEKDDSLKIELNPNWKEYLTSNYQILLDYSFWGLSLYVQKLNLNTPNVSAKLAKPIQRESLLKQRKLWNVLFDKNNSFNCIYTNKPLYRDGFDMEHFIPWSFVAHNHIWNLIPSDGSINSSKGNKLPSLKKYLKPFVEIQREFIKVVYDKSPTNKFLEEYLFLSSSIPKILNLKEQKLISGFENTMEPLIQVASNSGFEFWNR